MQIKKHDYKPTFALISDKPKEKNVFLWFPPLDEQCHIFHSILQIYHLLQ
ncbi:hypothetical protein Hanom_Chr01g00086971 [Helianthus anomalus]